MLGLLNSEAGAGEDLLATQVSSMDGMDMLQSYAFASSQLMAAQGLDSPERGGEASRANSEGGASFLFDHKGVGGGLVASRSMTRLMAGGGTATGGASAPANGEGSAAIAAGHGPSTTSSDALDTPGVGDASPAGGTGAKIAGRNGGGTGKDSKATSAASDLVPSSSCHPAISSSGSKLISLLGGQGGGPPASGATGAGHLPAEPVLSSGASLARGQEGGATADAAAAAASAAAAARRVAAGARGSAAASQLLAGRSAVLPSGAELLGGAADPLAQLVESALAEAGVGRGHAPLSALPRGLQRGGGMMDHGGGGGSSSFGRLASRPPKPLAGAHGIGQSSQHHNQQQQQQRMSGLGGDWLSMLGGGGGGAVKDEQHSDGAACIDWLAGDPGGSLGSVRLGGGAATLGMRPSAAAAQLAAPRPPPPPQPLMEDDPSGAGLEVTEDGCKRSTRKRVRALPLLPILPRLPLLPSFNR